MYIQRLKCKIHNVRVTDANREYEGSITIDRGLMLAARIGHYDLVHINCIDTGKHWETYAIPGGDGEICLNGAAANHFDIGDRVHILCYSIYEHGEYHEPKIVNCNDKNENI